METILNHHCLHLLLIFIKNYLVPLVITFGAVFGYIQYARQQKFKRIQNLSSLWKNFSSDNEVLRLFSLMDEIESGKPELIDDLKKIARQDKLKYLALVEEVSLYVEKFEVDKDFATYLFQWHFYFPYQSKLTSIPFWENIGGAEEMNASYWAKSRNLSASIKPEQ